MAFLQKRFPYPAKLSVLKNKEGFMLVSLLCFLSLMMTVLLAFSLLSLGIKNITKSQSLCIKSLIQTQKELEPLLRDLLALNNRVRQLHQSRRSLDFAIVTALASVVLAPTVPKLKKMRDGVKQGQKAIQAQQKALLLKSVQIKTKNLNYLRQKLKAQKAKNIREQGLFKKALAVKKEKLGDKAVLYKPMENFKQKQKITLLWTLNPFRLLPANRSFLGLKGSPNVSLSCTATLQKQGGLWKSQLYH